MIQTRQIGNLTEISVTDGYLHKIGTDTYVKKCILLPNLSVEDYEEVDSIPPYTKDEYDKKVAELVRERYSADEEFAIQRKMMNTMLSPTAISEDANTAAKEYREYNNFVNECKQKAKDANLYKVDEPFSGGDK